MIDNEEAKWTPQTDIMKRYLNLEPQYKIIYKNGPNQKVVKVELKNNIEFILKQLRIKSTNKSDIDHLLREYRISNTLGKLTDGIAMSKDAEKKKVGEYTVIEILMEYGGISLSTFMNRGELREGDTMNIACQLLSTLTLMEEFRTSHLDIKPCNIVWDKSKNQVKLIDFGTSLMSLAKDNGVFKETDSKRILGYTRPYSAPEIKKKAKRIIPQKLDVYSFGVTFLRLLAAEYKVQNLIEYDENSFIKKFNLEKLKEKVKREDMDDLWEIIYKTIESTPQSRPTFRELREVFLKQAKVITEDDYLLDVIDSLNDHPIKIELINNVELNNIYISLMFLYAEIENYDIAIKCGKKYLETCSELEEESSLDVAISYFLLGALYFNINEKKEAINYLEKALSILLKIPGEHNGLLKMIYRAMGLVYTFFGDYKKAKEQSDKAFNIKLEECDVGLDFYCSVLEIFTYMGEYERIEEMCDKVLKEIKKKKSVQDISIARLYIILGYVYFSKGSYVAAKKILNEGLNMLLSEYGEQNMFLIPAYLFLGYLDSSIGKFDQAIEAFDKALSISLEINGEIHLYTMILYQYKAFAYLDKEDYKRSIDFLKESLNISLRKFGAQNQFTLELYLYLGMSYRMIDDFIIAKSYLQKALDIAVKIFKEENILYVLIYNSIGILYIFYESNVDKGIHYCNRALNILLKIYDKDHPLLFTTYVLLVFGYFFKLDYQEVIRLCNICLDILLRTGTKESQMVGTLSFFLAFSYFSTGNKELGTHYSIKVLKNFSSICGNQNVFSINPYCLLGQLYLIKGDHVQALKMANELSKVDESITIKGNIHTLLRYTLLGNVYRFQEDYLNAEAACKQALETSLNVYGELNFITAACLYLLGCIYVELENIKEAEKCLNKALNIQMKISAETHYATGNIYFTLAIIYKRTGRYKEALYALNKSLNILNLYPMNNKGLLSTANEMRQELCDIIEMINMIQIT